ncbi:MAG: ATP-binding protein [Armatimonadetes bacterium]|nr:ATP-binding protein [Armatimonadota bacterium]
MADVSAFEEAKRLLEQRRRAREEVLPDLPPAPASIEETGLRESFLVDLVVKLLFLRGNLEGRQICDAVGLPYQGIMEHVIRQIKDDMLAAVRRGDSVRELDWEFAITEKGGNVARDLIQRNGYAGPAPVPLERYVEVAGEQRPEWQQLNCAHMRQALSGLVVSDEMLLKLGPAFNSGKSMFLYGNAGNGKTLISERMSSSMRGGILIPQAIEAGGQVVQLFDPTHHEILGDEELRNRQSIDRRWLVVRRPFIIVGGELAMADLEMAWDESHRHYIAPMQLKANGGVFMIDDFGRQQVPVRDLLNRWIVPLEKGYDYHLLSGGVQVQVPFNLLIIFSTNLAPKDLVEEAFLRRIKYKIEIGDPTETQFREIFVNFCGKAGVEYRPAMLDYLIEQHYRRAGRQFRATHPRDLLLQLVDIARFNELSPELTPELLDAAVATYFVDLG